MLAGLAALVLVTLASFALIRQSGVIDGPPPTETDPTVTDDDQGESTEFTVDGITLTGVATDNYKAAFNEDPSLPELRTWLAIENVKRNGTTYTHTVDAGDDGFALVESARLESADGERLLATATVTDPGQSGATVVTRSGPQEGRWGPLLTLPAQMTEDAELTTVCIRFRRPNEQQPVGEVCAEYQYDEALATAPEDSLEHNGPGGRWYIDGQATLTNLESGWE